MTSHQPDDPRPGPSDSDHPRPGPSDAAEKKGFFARLFGK
jgi:hypothetical protein